MPHESHASSRSDSLNRSTVIVAVATLMVLEAISLAVASALHLSGVVHGRSASFDPDAAGLAEAIIGVVLAIAAGALIKDGVRARGVGIAATSFALAGFLVGITETSRGGDIPDITYHATLIPLLIGGLVLLIRASGAGVTSSIRPGDAADRPDPVESALR